MCRWHDMRWNFRQESQAAEQFMLMNYMALHALVVLRHNCGLILAAYLFFYLMCLCHTVFVWNVVKTHDKIFFNLENEYVTDVKFAALNKYVR